MSKLDTITIDVTNDSKLNIYVYGDLIECLDIGNHNIKLDQLSKAFKKVYMIGLDDGLDDGLGLL